VIIIVLSILQREAYRLLPLLEINRRSISTGSKYHDIGRAGLGYRHHRAIVGSPSIQEMREINEKAEEIHQRKFQEVKKAAERERWIRRWRSVFGLGVGIISL